MRPVVARLRRRLGDDADHPTYVFTDPRVGYWMPAGEVLHDRPIFSEERVGYRMEQEEVVG